MMIAKCMRQWVSTSEDVLLVGWNFDQRAHYRGDYDAPVSYILSMWFFCFITWAVINDLGDREWSFFFL